MQMTADNTGRRSIMLPSSFPGYALTLPLVQ
jgi:hypothetical protein